MLSPVRFLITQRWTPRLLCPVHLLILQRWHQCNLIGTYTAQSCAHPNNPKVGTKTSLSYPPLQRCKQRLQQCPITWLLNFRRFRLILLGTQRWTPSLFNSVHLFLSQRWTTSLCSPVYLKPLLMLRRWNSKEKNTWLFIFRLIWFYTSSAPLLVSVPAIHREERQREREGMGAMVAVSADGRGENGQNKMTAKNSAWAVVRDWHCRVVWHLLYVLKEH